MKGFSLSVLMLVAASCSGQRGYRPYQGFQRYVDTVPQASAAQDRYFTEADWADPYAGSEWGFKKISEKAVSTARAESTAASNDRNDRKVSRTDRTEATSDYSRSSDLYRSAAGRTRKFESTVDEGSRRSAAVNRGQQRSEVSGQRSEGGQRSAVRGGGQRRSQQNFRGRPRRIRPQGRLEELESTPGGSLAPLGTPRGSLRPISDPTTRRTEEYKAPVREELLTPVLQSNQNRFIQSVNSRKPIPESNSGGGAFFSLDIPEDDQYEDTETHSGEEHPGSLFGIFGSSKPRTEPSRSTEQLQPSLVPTLTTDGSDKAADPIMWSDAGYDTDSWGNIDRQPSTTFKPVLIDDRSEPARAKIKPKRWNSDFEKFKTRLFQEKPRDTPVRKPLAYDRTRPRIENQYQESNFPYDPISPIPKPVKPSQRKRINKINRVKDANSDEILEDQKSFNVRPLGNRRMSRPPTRSERPIQPRFETSSQFSQPRPNTPRFIRPFTDRNFDINRGFDIPQFPGFVTPPTAEFQKSDIGLSRGQMVNRDDYLRDDDIDAEDITKSGQVLPGIIVSDRNEPEYFEEKSKEGLGEYGPFFDLSVPDTKNLPFKEVTTDQGIESSKEPESAPAIFLPTMYPDTESSAVPTVKPIVSQTETELTDIEVQPSEEPESVFTDFISSIPELEDDVIEEVTPDSKDTEIGSEKQSITERQFENKKFRDFMSKRTRSPEVSTSTMAPSTSTASIIRSTTTLPVDRDSIGNILEENEYSKTHIRMQKIRPREEKKEAISLATDPSTTPDNILEENNYSKTEIRGMKTKKKKITEIDLSKIQFKDITKKIPAYELKKLLENSGFSINDIFRKTPDAMELVLKAMDNENFLKNQVKEFDSKGEGKMDVYDDDDTDTEEKNKEPTVRIPWPSRPKPKKSIEKVSKDFRPQTEKSKPKWVTDEPRVKPKWADDVPKMTRTDEGRSIEPNKDGSDNEVDNESDTAAMELEKLVDSMDVKSLMKRISPMSLSEVLSAVGFSLPDIMTGNKKAIKSVLKYHMRKTGNFPPSEVKTTTRSNKWSPSGKDEDKKTTEVFSPTVPSTTTSTTKMYPGKKTAADLFEILRRKKYPTTTTTTTTTKSTTKAENMVTSSYRFGERTTKRRYGSFQDFQDNRPYRRRNKEEEKVDISEEDSFTTTEMKSSEDTEQPEEMNVGVTTPQYDMLNYTLSNLNMTVDDLKERKDDLSVPAIGQIFTEVEKKEKEDDIIYGETSSKAPSPAPQAPVLEVRPVKKQRPKYVQMDFGAGGYRGGYGNPFSGGWGGGSRAGLSIITDRRTTTTTRAPITYFDVNGDLVEKNIDVQSLSEESLLGDYEITDFYEYDNAYYDYNGVVREVPEGVKSALIASSVVGGLAVSLFLSIFMLCLWKQMKSKLRLSENFEEEQGGLFSSLFGKGRKNKLDKEPNGYFNKVNSNIEEPNYSTTSSEEY